MESRDAEERHLDWSAKQGRILTDRGRALQYYTEANGFPFSAEVNTNNTEAISLIICFHVSFNLITRIRCFVGMSALPFRAR